MPTEKGHTVVLMSGGIDSSATLVALQEAGISISGVFIDYRQPSAISEWEAAQKIAGHYRIKIERIELSAPLICHQGEFWGRNALMILIAAGTIESRPLSVAIGIHALTEYYDTTPLFLKHMERLLNGYSGGTVTLKAPFLTETKSEVIQFAKGNEVPLNLTYSCEQQNEPACGQCQSCSDRSKLNAN